jgi:hypothetical protein
VYQIAEDATRGDRTLAVVWGPRACCLFAVGCTAIGGAVMVSLLAARYGPLDAGLVALGLLAQTGLLLWLSTTLANDDTLSRYRRVMRLARLSAAGLGSYLLVRLFVA